MAAIVLFYDNPDRTETTVSLRPPDGGPHFIGPPRLVFSFYFFHVLWKLFQNWSANWCQAKMLTCLRVCVSFLTIAYGTAGKNWIPRTFFVVWWFYLFLFRKELIFHDFIICLNSVRIFLFSNGFHSSKTFHGRTVLIFRLFFSWMDASAGYLFDFVIPSFIAKKFQYVVVSDKIQRKN